MKICCVSPVGYSSPGLFETFPAPFHSAGHEIIPESRVEQADVVFFDLHSGFAPYDEETKRRILSNGKPVVIFDAFDFWGAPGRPPAWQTFNWWEGKDIQTLWNQDWAIFVKNAYAQNLVKVHFVRKGQKSETYPRHVRPLNLCGYTDHNFPLTTKEELSSRYFDVCFIGASSPWRANFVCDLLADKRIKVDYFWPVHRIEHPEWLDRHRQAKMFIEADGGGFGSERPYQLMRIAPMLKQKNDQLIHEDWTHQVDCLEFGNTWGRLSMAALDELICTVNDPDKLYDIYLKGAQRLEQHHSHEARANYVLNTLKELL
jgi:hypothetical protein